jgi:tetratricopeptide (TPR) repeat protein
MVRANKRRRPARPAAFSTAGDGPSAGIPLRLAVTKGGLGLELDHPLALGPLEVEQLSVSLVGLSFPVDLSGGVARFRHRRGALEHLGLTARRDQVAAALAPRMRGAIGATSPVVSLTAIPGGVTVGLVDGATALAFDVLWAPTEGDVRLVVSSPRSIGLATPSLGAALRAMDAAVGHAGTRAGPMFSFADAASIIARRVLPDVGARVPDTSDLRWGLLEADTFGFRAVGDRTYSPPALSPHVVREIELAKLTEAADDALVASNLDEARDIYLALLESSPRDTGLARRLADLDRTVGGRKEAALSTLLEAMPIAEGGFLAGELLATTGSAPASINALKQAAAREIYGPLAALALLRAAEQTETVRDRLDLLDQAIARSPALEAPRWARFAIRLELADLQGAMADAEHLEAATRGAHRRHEVWRRAAVGFLDGGHAAKAITLFERALRYAPDNPMAVSGLAQSLLQAGRSGRALDLMARAVELAEKKGSPAYAAVLALARALADHASDFPHAIARLRSIPAGEAESLDARGLEGRYRGMLGDLAGASIAFAQMRDTVELAKEIASERAAAWLVEAARFEREAKKDALAAQRHLGVALQLQPRDGRILSMFREVAAEAAAPSKEIEKKPGNTVAAAFDPARDEERAAALAERLRGDPDNHRVALELADILARLGRDIEVFALLSARIEDATPETRPELLPRQTATLERLIESARHEKRDSEAEIYTDALRRLREGAI